MSSLPALEKIIGFEFGVKVIGDMILAFWRITNCMFVTKTGHHIMKKGERFGTLIFTISNKLSRSSEYELIRKDVRFLREMYSEFKPELSAAAVFSIDYSVYYALFTLIMSYLAILMQFKYPNN
nr:uncharacterized protein LOC111421747 [Onthophagus taurus]